VAGGLGSSGQRHKSSVRQEKQVKKSAVHTVTAVDSKLGILKIHKEQIVRKPFTIHRWDNVLA
jgi:hypothetical protein